MERIKIACAIGSLSGGGAERQVLQIVKHLDRSRFQPFLYLVHREGEFLSQVPEDVSVDAFSDVFSQPRIHWPGRIHRQQVGHLAKVLRSRHIDLIYDRTYLMTLLAAPASRRCQIPRVSVVASDLRNDFVNTAGRYAFLKRCSLSRAYREAARVLVVSQGVRQAAIEFSRIPEERIDVCPNLFDFDEIERMASQPLSKPFSSTGFHVVAAGRLAQEKGLDCLLEAMSELVHQRHRQTIHLWLLGQGPLEAELREFVRARRLESRVHFEGFCRNPFSFVRCANLFCLSSLYEGFPNVMVEAMACGTPVVATDCPSGPREISEDGRLGSLVPVGNPTALANAIEAIMDDYASARQVAEAAKKHVKASFGLEIGMQKLQDLFVEIVQTQSA